MLLLGIFSSWFVLTELCLYINIFNTKIWLQLFDGLISSRYFEVFAIQMFPYSDVHYPDAILRILGAEFWFPRKCSGNASPNYVGSMLSCLRKDTKQYSNHVTLKPNNKL